MHCHEKPLEHCGLERMVCIVMYSNEILIVT